MIVKHSDLAAMKFCNRGARQFFERHGLNWQEFITNGIDSSRVEAIDDEMMRQVVAHAHRREQEGV